MAVGWNFMAQDYHEYMPALNGRAEPAADQRLTKLGGFGEGVEGGDSFDEAGDGEGIEDAAGFAD